MLLGHQSVEFDEIGFPLRIEIEIGLQTVRRDPKHLPLAYLTGIQISIISVPVIPSVILTSDAGSHLFQIV